MQLALVLLTIQGVMGAFDNLWNHEFKVRLAWRLSARRELTLHTARQIIYAVVFATIGWWRWEGAFAYLLAAMLILEIGITLWDFVEEDRTRKLSGLERVTHGLLTLNYGAVLALMALEFPDWAAQPTGFSPVDYGVLSVVMSLYAGAVALSVLRDTIAIRRLGKQATAVQRRQSVAIAPAQRPMTVLVAGGTGFIGAVLCRQLIEDGHRVIVKTRSREKACELFGSQAEIVERLNEIDAGRTVDAVVNLAGAPVVGLPWTRRRKRVLLESRLATTQDIVDWMAGRKLRPHVLINGSAVGFYGDGGEHPLGEASAMQGGFLSELCFAWERVARQADLLGIRVVLLRTGLVLGREGGMFASMSLAFRMGLGGKLGNGLQWMPWIHLQDLIGLIRHAMAETSLAGPLNATAPAPVRNCVLTKQLAFSLHRPAILNLPARVLRLLLGEMSDLFLASQRVLPRRAQQTGYRFRFCTLKEAIDDLVG